jgi:predicted lipoprotein with Yx(FWY)xxD motif
MMDKQKGDKMKKILLLFAVLVSLLLGLQQANATTPDVTVFHKEGIGNYLADANGRTLYWTKKDMPGSNTCVNSPNIDKWPPFFNGAILSASPEMASKEFGTMIRKDGRKQNTFRGYPLYYSSLDQEPGDTLGHKVDAAWSVMLPGKFHLVEKVFTGYSVTVGTTD